MTLKEAIEANEHLAIELDASGQDRLAKGVRLGIEALKREQIKRTTMAFHPDDLLSGETYIPLSVGKLPSDKDEE